MNEGPNSNRSPYWTSQQLAELKSRLQRGGQTPPGLDRLLGELAEMGRAGPRAEESSLLPLTEEESDAMLSIAINDALHGIDIASAYPLLYRRLLADARLSEAFLGAMNALLPGSDLQPAPLPYQPSRDLSFLHTAPRRPAVSRLPGGSWQVIWQKAIRDLEDIFFASPLVPGPVMRRDAVTAGDLWFILLNEEYALQNTHLFVLLQAKQLAERPQELELHLTVSATPAAADGPEPTPLQATIRWGDYHRTHLIDADGEALFAPVAFDHVLDTGWRSVLSDLQLSLEPAASHYAGASPT